VTLAAGPARVRRIFDAAARLYDAALVQRFVYRPAQDAAVAVLRAAGSRWVLDAGCGTGILASRVRDGAPGVHVVGCDLSLGMLRRARERAPLGAWVQADAARLPLRDGALDAVVSTHAFHFVPGRGAALAEFCRVLAPGGLLAIVMLNPRTAVGSRLMSEAGTRALGAGWWPTRGRLHDEVLAAGFELRSQRGTGHLAQEVLTVAVRGR